MANESDRQAGIHIPPGTTLEDLERAAVEQALGEHQGNRTHAAKALGISVRTLQRKLKAWHGSSNHIEYLPSNENRSAINSMRPQPTWSPLGQGMSHPLIARPHVARV
jgi:hypothetical protein